jgi:hypothetical protein
MKLGLLRLHADLPSGPPEGAKAYPGLSAAAFPSSASIGPFARISRSNAIALPIELPPLSASAATARASFAVTSTGASSQRICGATIPAETCLAAIV